MGQEVIGQVMDQEVVGREVMGEEVAMKGDWGKGGASSPACKVDFPKQPYFFSSLLALLVSMFQKKVGA